MTPSPIVQTVTIGASLTATVTFRADMFGENIGINSPVASPTVALDVRSPAGSTVAVLPSTAIPQKTIFQCRYQLKGLCSFILTVANQGTYVLEFFPRSNQ